MPSVYSGNIISFGLIWLKALSLFGERHWLDNHILSSMQNYSCLLEIFNKRSVWSVFISKDLWAFLTSSNTSYFRWWKTKNNPEWRKNWEIYSHAFSHSHTDAPSDAHRRCDVHIFRFACTDFLIQSNKTWPPVHYTLKCCKGSLHIFKKSEKKKKRALGGVLPIKQRVWEKAGNHQ